MHVHLLTCLCIRFYFELLSIRHIVTTILPYCFAMLLPLMKSLPQMLTRSPQSNPQFKPQGPDPLHKKICYKLKHTVFLHK